MKFAYIVTGQKGKILGVFNSMANAKASLTLSHTKIGPVLYIPDGDKVLNWFIAERNEPAFKGTIIMDNYFTEPQHL